MSVLHAPEELLVGIAPGGARRDHTARLAPGSTLLLFTDGLVERRSSDLDAGLARLTRALRGAAGRSAEQVCDLVFDRLAPEESEDDIALLAVRCRA